MRARALCGQSRSPNAGAVETLRRWRRAAPVADEGGVEACARARRAARIGDVRPGDGRVPRPFQRGGAVDHLGSGLLRARLRVAVFAPFEAKFSDF